MGPQGGGGWPIVILMSLAGSRLSVGRQLPQPLREGVHGAQSSRPQGPRLSSPGNRRLELRTRPCGGQEPRACRSTAEVAVSCPFLLCGSLGVRAYSGLLGLWGGARDPDLTGALCSPHLSESQSPCLRSGVDSHPLTVLWDEGSLHLGPFPGRPRIPFLPFLPFLPVPLPPGGGCYVRLGLGQRTDWRQTCPRGPLRHQGIGAGMGCPRATVLLRGVWWPPALAHPPLTHP